MSSDSRRQTLLRSLLFVLLLAVAGGLIFFLKRSTDVPLTPEGLAGRDSTRHMAVPDTLDNAPASPAEAPAESTPAEDVSPAPDRDPAEAGYDDGYLSGNTDGMNNDERATYDESSQYSTPDERQSYAAAYRRGYAAGFADGRKQAVGADPRNDNDNAHDGDATPDGDTRTAPGRPDATPRSTTKPTAPRPDAPRLAPKNAPRP